MKKRRSVLECISDEISLPGETIPGQSIVEILGDGRVLIENHFGVTEYNREKIGVKVRFGQIMVCGCGLELRHMSHEQLVISGRIDSVCLIRRSNR